MRRKLKKHCKSIPQVGDGARNKKRRAMAKYTLTGTRGGCSVNAYCLHRYGDVMHTDTEL